MRREVQSTIAATIVAFNGGAMTEGSTPASQAASVPRSIPVRVYFLDATGKPSPVQAIPRDLTIRLGAMAGRFGGRGDETLLTIRVGEGQVFRLDLSDLSERLSVRTAELSKREVAPLKLTPGDAKFARVSTVALSGADPLIGLAVVFWDLEAGGSLVPIYFDRPCQLRILSAADESAVDIPAAGLVWMLSVKNKNSRYIHTLADNPHPAIMIAPPEALEKISSTAFLGRR